MIEKYYKVAKKMLKKGLRKFFFFGFYLDPNRRTSRCRNLLSKMKSKMLENGALWATFIQNGALVPIGKNRKKLNSMQHPH